jgi:hypothetical protein
MRHTAKQGLRAVGVVALAVTFLTVFLLMLQVGLSLEAAPLEPAANNLGMSIDILPASGAYHGAVIHLEQIGLFECMVGRKLSIIKVYQHFHNRDFYQNWAESIDRYGAIEFLSLDPTISETIIVTCDGKTEAVSRTLHPDEVMSPVYTGVITQFASHIRDWGHPLILSFAGEMNGCDCQPVNWQGCRNGSVGPEKYVQMYRYVYNIFKAAGANNVLWAWVVNHESIPNEDWNQIDHYYPGDSYVDIISVDGYNWGNNGPGGWKTFDQVFSPTLTSLSSTYPTKPFMLGEFASVEGTGPLSKANWIADAYSYIKSDWPQIKAALWFNFPGDWSFPVESSPESVQAYRQAITDPYFIGDRPDCIHLPLILRRR